MADQTASLIVRDGTTPSPSARQLGCTVDGTSVYYPVHNLRSDGANVSTAAPLPVVISPLLSVVTVTSPSLESSRLLKSGAGKVLSVHLNATDSGWFMLLDAVAAPADGPVTPKKAWQFQASAPATIDIRFDPPLAVTNGAVLVFSSTGPFTKTALAAAMLSGEVISSDVAPGSPSSAIDQFSAGISSLPTSLPATSGVLWNNGGLLSVS